MRQEVLDAAKALLLAEGPDAVTLSAVSNRLGVTKPAIYHYFPSKEALTRSLVATLIDEEIGRLESAVEAAAPGDNPIGPMIRAFHTHYRANLHAFRFVYGQLQLYVKPGLGIDAEMVRSEITPRTRHLFDLMELRLGSREQEGRESREGRSMRRLAFVAWMSVLGLLTMIAIAEGMDDPLLYPDEELLETIISVFENATPSAEHE
jgi:AcrR family transcriptional regulator